MINQNELESFMDLFFEVHRKMDHDKLTTLYHFPLVSIGTSQYEFNQYFSEDVYKDMLKSDYINVSTMKIEEILPRHISIDRNNAWVVTRFNVKIEDTEKKVVTMSCRLSLILKKIKQRWLIVHQHYSVPDHLAQDHEAYPGQNTQSENKQ